MFIFYEWPPMCKNVSCLWVLNDSVQFSHSVGPDSLRPHELQHARPPCPSPTPGVYSNSSPSSRWCLPAISSSVIPFSSCPQSLQESGSFPTSQLCMRWPKYWSFSFRISPSNEHPGLISFRMDWLDLLAVQGTLKISQHHSSKAAILQRSAFFTVQLSHPHMTTGKTIALTRGNFVGKVMSLLFNMLSRLAITLFPRSKRLLISWMQSPSPELNSPIPVHFSWLIAKMLVFTLAICSLTTLNSPWLTALAFLVPMRYCSLQHWASLSPPDTPTTEHRFCCGPALSLELSLCSSSVAYWTPSNLGVHLLVSYLSCLFMSFVGISSQEYWSSLLFLPPVDHTFSELSAVTHPSWVALWLITSLSYASPFTTARLQSIKGQLWHYYLWNEKNRGFIDLLIWPKSCRV